MAVGFVEEAMPFGAENNEIDMALRKITGCSPPISLRYDRAYRRAAQQGMYAKVLDPRANVESTLWQAEHTYSARVGLCDEQAALAAGYLIQEMHQTGVGLFAIDGADKKLKFGHVFVVLGLATEPLRKQYLSFNHYPLGWENAVWCDPWAKDCFQVTAGWPDRVKRIMHMLPNAEEAMASPINLTCEMYFDGEKAKGTLV